MTFYRPGGGDRINQQYDTCYTDTVGNATAWLPVSRGNAIAINICRAAITFVNPNSSTIKPSPIAPECVVLMEMAMFPNEKSTGLAVPIDNWENMVVAAERVANRDGWVRLRLLNINNLDGTGVRLDLQVSRNSVDGSSG